LQLWHTKAAQGDAWAQVYLGVLYTVGHRVPQDNVRAYMWFSLAATGHASAHFTDDDQRLAVSNRALIARIMTPAQIAEAQRLTQQCQARQFKGC
jgi:TPR repeat protein